MRIRPRIEHRRSPKSVRLDPVAAEAVRLGTLLEVVTRAVALQDQADKVIRDCAEPGEVPTEVARCGRSVASEYGRLSGWAADLAWTDPAPQRIGALLSYHLMMLDTALKLAFPRCRTERLERHRLALTGLGPPADELRDWERVLERRLANLDHPTG
ncbi:hypothetical protein [Saccharothrix syringae]|uniref:Uncharacterized protein n=1 Tax=Saccharothrix syringae TaxID=103733 RepID=A0A5Q0GZR7_SACSY|nr:hypothetical protein [Saccharothrix syringae]QFZ19448.1 hypothetical protein EKG83_20175 [Saccharothrix syringae]